MNGWVGKFLGRYQVVELLGEGGMATVYKAVDTRLDREVAIKAIRSEDFPPSQAERLRKRFDREARVLAQLTHTNIVPIIDYGEHEGAPYLVMPYLPGGALKRREKGMPWREALRLVLPIADALAYAHAHGILHRDVNPSNILMTETGLPMLSDFGIARLLEDESGHTLTGTGGIGTPGYMAPEQVVGSKGLDVRADVYSLGVVLYELVAGRMPFEAERPSGILLKQMTEAPPPLGQVVKDIPPKPLQPLT
ncbi:MAG: serine/threonine-protein kinase [Anaerolineales bacterium]